MRSTPRLTRQFYRRATLTVARDLLGRVLCRRSAPGTVLRGRIVEVEAYDGTLDRASHAYRGATARNRVMFGRGGSAYVYLIYGMYHCVNVVTGDVGFPAAVLIRAVELSHRPAAAASGPGKLCREMGIERMIDGCSLAGRELWLEQGWPIDDRRVRRTPRIGVDYAGAWARKAYRFIWRGHPALSGPARMR